MTYVVEMNKITKKFPGVTANDRVCFYLKKNSIHGLLGENGAGKTTLMNILYGLCTPENGEVSVNGKRVLINSPSKAIELNIGMVHQHFMLVRPLTVVENIILGLPSAKKPFLDIRNSAQKIEEISNKYNFEIDPYAKISDLSVGQQQRVEILSVLYRGAQILILDEPTAVLTPQESEKLFTILRSMRDDGKSVVIISHKLEEILNVTDEVTVLRDGKLIGSELTEKVSKKILTNMMVGRDVIFDFEKNNICGVEAILKIENLTAMDTKGRKVLKKINICLNNNEILGIAGVDGNGQKELCDAIYGLLSIASGKVTLDNKDITNWGVKQKINSGIAYIPEDRQKTGLLMNSSIMKNLAIKHFDTKKFSGKLFVDYKAIKENAKDMILSYNIKTTNADVPTKNLSGGNQQKVVLGREISSLPKVILANQPTRGLDIGAIEYVRQKLLDQRDNGTGIILVSADLEEIFQLSDRIAVIYKGEILSVFTKAEATMENIGLLMAGVRGETDVSSEARIV